MVLGFRGVVGLWTLLRACTSLWHLPSCPLPPSPGNVNVTMLNYSAAAYEFLRAFRAGRLGKVTLD